MKGKMKVLLLNIAHWLVTVLSRIIPQRNNSIMIYGFRLLDDNSRALFFHLINEGYNKKYTIFCTAKNIEEFRNIKIRNVKFSSGLLQILWAHIRSQYIFYSIATVFTNTPSKRQTIVNMWHGSPLKRIGYMDNEKQWRNLASTFTFLCVASSFFKPIMQRSFRCADAQILINGNPRCDALLWNKENDKVLMEADSYSKLILWMPTYRNDGRGEKDSENQFPILTVDGFERLNLFLKRKGMLLIVKPHQLQISLKVLQLKYDNIRVIYNEELFNRGVDLYALLRMADALITDYSSVYFDYLLLNRPIGFTVDDIDSYRLSRGFSVKDYKKLMPGMEIHNYEDLIAFLNNVNDGKDDYEDERIRVNDLVNERKQGFSEYLLQTVGITK